MDKDNSIYVGAKPFMNYVTAVVMQFTTKGASEVILKARGKFIARAVDVSEVAMKRFLEGQLAHHSISIDSEEFKNKEGKLVRVSTIEIVLSKAGETGFSTPEPVAAAETGFDSVQAQ